MCFSFVAACNWIVNPFGQYSPKLMKPIVQDSRSEKFELFERLESQPDGLILGSSRAMKFEPSYLAERTSLSFFNFSVNHGRPEDFLATVRMYRSRFGKFPKAVLIGVDVASLNDIVPNDARLSAEPKLFAFVRDVLPWNEEFDRFSQLLSYQQFSSSIKSICAVIGLKGTKENEERFDGDGVIQYLKRQSQLADGTYNFEDAIEYNEQEFLSVFGQLKELSTKRLDYLRETIRLCESNDCQVYLFTTVNHPQLRAVLIAKTEFPKIEQKAIQVLTQLAQEYGAQFVDFGTIESFAGDAKAFVDGIHPLESNTRRMVDRVMPRSSEANYAIQ